MKQEIIKENIILEDISSDIKNELLIEQIVCELESQCTDSSDIPEIEEMEMEKLLRFYDEFDYEQFDYDFYDYIENKINEYEELESMVLELESYQENPDDNLIIYEN